ncbi:Dps family protein [Streptacidiphilus rugosus]|uniref:Dps family protein n=1 Tax=Streptacidiphilus rugosus TaxID=405783 RepID=UPI000565816D|nr:DNA starvation/stationary phase protection protein [Streptacidiphilus rugosus]
MPTVDSPLTQDERVVTSEVLQGTLVDLLDLALVGKQMHWNVYGPRFRSVHLQLDELVELARLHADAVAERAATIGSPPDGRAGTIAATSGIASPAGGWVKDDEAVATLVAALRSVITRLRERIPRAGDHDPVSQDLLIGITADLEKQSWMFQAEHSSG